MYKELQSFSFFWLVVAAVIFVYSFQYDSTSRYFPMLASGGAGLLCIADMIVRWRTRKPEEDKGKEPLINRSFLRMVAWLIGLLVLLKFVTYLIAVPLFIFLLLWLEAKERWKVSLAIAAGVGIFMFAVFELFLDATF